MQRSLPIVLALTLSATAYAQFAGQPAYPAGQQPGPQPGYQQSPPMPPQVNSTQPAQGVWLRSEANSSVKTVSADANGTELRVEHGRANVQVSHAAPNAQIMVDLPGGQTSLIKDGLYTFNADTNTVRVLRGEADVYLDANAKPIKVKEDHQVTFAAGATKSVEVDPRQLAADVLPGARGSEGYAGYDRGYAPRGYGYGPYGDGYYPPVYPYPYYAYGFGYPYYGYGYPFGFGVGFGYYGGFRGGFRR